MTAWAETLPEPLRAEVLILLEDAVEFDRADPLIREAAIALGLAAAETVGAALEQAWREAAADRVSAERLRAVQAG